MHPNEQTNASGGSWLNKAAAERTAITLHVKTKSGWVSSKSQLLALDGQYLKTACPQAVASGELEIEVGQTVGVALRKGHKKILFDSEFIGRDEQTGHLILSQPMEMQQLQRRTYARTRVPDHLTIPVNVTRLGTGGSVEKQAVPRRGILLDLSAGGMSVAVPPDSRSKWRRGDMMRCLLPLEPAQEPQELTARVRFVEKAPQGHLRMGMQFVGLETSTEGRATLKVIARATSRYRNAACRNA